MTYNFDEMIERIKKAKKEKICVDKYRLLCYNESQ